MSPAMFTTLESSPESRKRSGMAFVGGLVVQIVMITVAILLGILFPQELPLRAKQYMVVWLPPLMPPRAVVAKPAHHVPLLPKPKPLVKPVVPVYAAAKIELPKFRPTPHALIPKVPQLPPVPTLARVNAEPKVQKLEVHTGTFGSIAEPVTTKRLAAQVQTGGFGTPEGIRGEAKGGSGGNVPKLGSFALPDGPGVGNGTGGAHGVPGVVASAGFGNGVATAASPYARTGSGVTVGGFQKVAEVAAFPTKSLPIAAPAADVQPLELISKPSPVYTEEARQLRIQGDVALSVVFQANGTIRILGVVKSLGHGLDQAAQQAASQIRFKPAQRDGKPVDFSATVRIEFRLADQTT